MVGRRESINQSIMTAGIWLPAECGNPIRNTSKGQPNQLQYARGWHGWHEGGTVGGTDGEITNYNTRNRTTMHVPIGTTENTYATFRFHGIYIWNLISERIPTDVSYSCLKHILNIYIQTHELNYRLRT